MSQSKETIYKKSSGKADLKKNEPMSNFRKWSRKADLKLRKPAVNYRRLAFAVKYYQKRKSFVCAKRELLK